MPINMCRIIDKSNFINVDNWESEKFLNDATDVVIKNVRGQIIYPIAEKLFNGDEEMKALDYFYMNSKRSYNSDEVRAHICRYLNFFEKYYDIDKELLMVVFSIKQQIDYQRSYTLDTFMDDVNRCIIRNLNLTRKIRHFVDDNYLLHLSSNNNKTPNLQFNDRHAKVLYEISMLMNIYIPLATHFMFVHEIKQSEEVHAVLLRLFDMCNTKYMDERHIDTYSKLYETSSSVVNKSKGPDKVLWEKNQIRGINTTIHTKESVYDMIFNIIPKYTYLDYETGEPRSIISFNYFSARQSLRYKITDIQYEFQFSKLSSSKRDNDQNSEYDRYEARLNKKDEALAMQNKVAAEQTVNRIEALYGPFEEDEIEHYRKKLTKDGAPVINPLQRQLVGYMYDKDFGDPVTINAIKNQTDYIKLIIAAKRILLGSGMRLLPYIISSRVLRTASRKLISKRDMIRIENSEQYLKIKAKYNNEKIEQKIWEFIGTIISSSFEIIDWDVENHVPGEYDGKKVPMINEYLNEELLFFISII